MSGRNNLKANQLNGFPDDVTKALLGKLNPDGSNQWGPAAGGVFPQTIAASGSKFIEAYDAATGLFTARRPTDADLSISDITTNNVSTSAHGFAPKAPNDATKFLDGTGAYSTPSGSGTAALILLEQHTASSSATLDFTTGITSTYDDYIIRLIDVVPANSSVDLFFRVSTNGGSSYDTSSNYFWGWNYVPNTGAAGIVQGTSATSITLFTAITNTARAGGVNGTFNMFNPGSASIRKGFTYHVVASQSSPVYTGTGFGLWDVDTAVNAVRFFFSAGNIASGTIRLYGVAK